MPDYGNDLQLDIAWAEAYSPQLKKWVHVDPVGLLVNKPASVEASLNASKLTSSRGSKHMALAYVVAIDSDGVLRDVTRRYAQKYSSLTSTLRVSEFDWWEHTLKALSASRAPAKRDEEEEEELEKSSTKENDFPTTRDAFRKHPLYDLLRIR